VEGEALIQETGAPETTTQEKEKAPDVRGGTGPVPLSILWAGWASIGLVILGTLLLQIWYTFNGPALSSSACTSNPALFRQVPKGTKIVLKPIGGALGTCHIITALRSSGETVFLLLTVVLGLAAMIAALFIYRRMPTKRMREQVIAGGVLGSQGLLVAVFLLWFRSGEGATRFANQFLNFNVLSGSVGSFVNGAKFTIMLAAGGELGGIILGMTLSLLTLSARQTVRAPARVYINFFRGTPLIWQLTVFYFGLAGLGVNLSAFQTGLLVFSLNTGAYSAEVFRAGIQSIERGQMEAARSLGMTYLQAMRFAIIPQAVRRVIPPLMNEFVILVKDTALVVVLGVVIQEREIFSVAQDGYASSANSTFYVAAAIGYLVITLPLIRLVNFVETRLRSGLTGIVGL
jgi:His/Glu/Gln/Arg/opine family amino acid ABC transporter permease subunit